MPKNICYILHNKLRKVKLRDKIINQDHQLMKVSEEEAGYWFLLLRHVGLLLHLLPSHRRGRQGHPSCLQALQINFTARLYIFNVGITSESSHSWHTPSTSAARAPGPHLARHLGDQSHHLGIILVLHDIGWVGGDILKCSSNFWISKGCKRFKIKQRMMELLQRKSTCHHLRVIKQTA